jgi:hypothetical protein
MAEMKVRLMDRLSHEMTVMMMDWLLAASLVKKTAEMVVRTLDC